MAGLHPCLTPVSNPRRHRRLPTSTPNLSLHHRLHLRGPEWVYLFPDIRILVMRLGVRPPGAAAAARVGPLSACLPDRLGLDAELARDKDGAEIGGDDGPEDGHR